MSHDVEFEAVLAAWLEAYDQGVAPDLEAFIARHPDHEEALRAYAEAEAWMRDAATSLGDGAAAATDVRPITPPAIDGFRIEREIARGGMGVVFEAVQESPRRRVAVKTLRDAVLATTEDVERFRREAQAAAELDHPGIVRILAVGTSAGRVWYSMPLASGGALRGRMGEFVGDPARAARLVCDVARAVAHGHARGILHRDLKPGNVLLDGQDNPLVADFGLARRMEPGADAHTRTGTVLGTPAYMPPEQARGDRRAIDERSDIWSLGTVLYELLTGRPPFVGAGPGDTLRQVLEEEVPSVRTHAPGIPRALAAICEQCLRRDPADRYASMRDLADDLDRWLRGEPVRARLPSLGARAWRWMRRRPAAVALLGGTVLALGAASVAVFFADKSELEQRRGRSRDLLIQAREFAEAGDEAHAALYFAAADIVHPSWAARRGLAAHAFPPPERLLPAGPHALWRVRWDGHGRWLATGGADGTLHVWDREERHRAIACTPGADVRGLAFDATGTRLASGDEDGRVRILALPDLRVVQEISLGAAPVFALAWLDDRRVVAGTGDGRLHLWNVGARTARAIEPPAADHDVRALAVQPDGTLLVAYYPQDAAGARVVRVDPEGGTVHPGALVHEGPVWDLAIDPRGRWAASADAGGVHIFDPVTLAPRFVIPHDAQVGALAVGASGDRLFSATVTGALHGWSTTTGRRVGRPRFHRSQVYGLATHPRTGHVAAVGMDGAVRIWRFPTSPGRDIALVPQRPKAPPHRLMGAMSPATGRVLVLHRDGRDAGRAELWEEARAGPTLTTRLEHLAHVLHVAHEDTDAGGDSWLALVTPAPGRDGHPHGVRVVRLRAPPPGAGEEKLAQEQGSRSTLAFGVQRARVLPTRRNVVVGGDKRVDILRIASDLALARERTIGDTAGWWVSWQGSMLLRQPHGAPRTFTVEPIDAPSRRRSFDVPYALSRGAVSEDGATVAFTLMDDQRVMVYDTRAREIRATIREPEVRSLTLLADGRALLSVTATGRMRTWDTQTGLPLGRRLNAGPFLPRAPLAYLSVAADVRGAPAWLYASTLHGGLLRFDLRWLDDTRDTGAVGHWRNMAQLGSMQSLDADGAVAPLPPDAWRRWRERLGR